MQRRGLQRGIFGGRVCPQRQLACCHDGHAVTFHFGRTLQTAQQTLYYRCMKGGWPAFRFECDMADPVASHISLAFDLDFGQRARLLREPMIGSVIPDMLLGIWHGDLPHCRGLNSVSRHVLAWLSAQKSAMSEFQLREDLFLSNQAAASALSALERRGAISKRDSGEVRLERNFDTFDSVRLIAIEMKLKRWREALDQAIAYREFADEAYAALDKNQVRLGSAARESFFSSGVGLLLLSGTEARIEIGAARSAPRPSADRMLALGKLASGPYCLA